MNGPELFRLSCNWLQFIDVHHLILFLFDEGIWSDTIKSHYDGHPAKNITIFDISSTFMGLSKEGRNTKQQIITLPCIWRREK